MKSSVLERFLRYVAIDTESDPNTGLTPSTPGQYEFAQLLRDELVRIGLQEVSLDDNGYLMACLPANTDEDIPTIGFIAHMDTSPDFSGKNVNPRIVENYDGKDIVLNADQNIVLSTNHSPELKNYQGQNIIVTDGTTLLGADDKAGLSEIVTAMEYLVSHPEIKHGKVMVGFTPDEEIGAGADYFDVEKFGAEFAYTIDGGQIGELEYENFNAASAKIQFHGISVHPGYAYHKMINSMRMANQFISMIPRCATPEHTTGYEGFYHLIGMEGSVELTTLNYIIRDHDRHKFEVLKKEIGHLVRKINAEFGDGSATVEIKDSYYNMREKVEPVKYIVDMAEEAMLEIGITPIKKPIRGGTDGARLSFMGLPCPNIFGGGHNFHGKFEYIPIQSMEKACELILRIIDKTKNLKK